MNKPTFQVGAFVMYVGKLPAIVTANEREQRCAYIRIDKADKDTAVYPVYSDSREFNPQHLRKGTFYEYMFKRNGYVGKWTPFDFYIRAGLVLSMYAGLMFGGSGISMPWYIAAYAAVTGIGAAMIFGAHAQFKQLQR